jgi:hypothetical protein
MLLRLLRIGGGLYISYLAYLIGWRLTDKEDSISYLDQLTHIQKEETDVHHQISPLSLLSRSLDPLGIVEPVELLLISTPIFLDYLNRYTIYSVRYWGCKKVGR